MGIISHTDLDLNIKFGIIFVLQVIKMRQQINTVYYHLLKLKNVIIQKQFNSKSTFLATANKHVIV